MDWQWRTLMVIAVAALAGCHTAPHVNAHLESVNAEYRQLEDYVYCLEEENARLQQEVDELKAKGTTGSSTGGRRSLFDRSRGPTGTSPRSDTPNLEPPQIEGIEPPTIEMPSEPSNTPPRRSTLQRQDLDPAPKLDLEPPSGLPAPVEPLPAPAPRPAKPPQPQPIPVTPQDTRVTHLFVNPVLTGGADLDGQPGDDGLRVVVEPRNSADQYVPQAGTVSVVVLDPTQPGELARVARWDFDLAATRSMLQAAAAGRGIKFEMPWPSALPNNPKLHLFVRYEGADGRKLQVDREIHLVTATASAQRWTPRPQERVEQQPAPAPQLLAPPAAAGQPAWAPYR